VRRSKIDPRIGGATLTVIANGGTAPSETFVLDAAGWSASGSGYRYCGPTGADGDSMKRVVVERTAGGTAAITSNGALHGARGVDRRRA
jgi:hypothetical protein